MDRKILIDLLDDFAFGSHNIEQTADRITELYQQEQALQLLQGDVSGSSYGFAIEFRSVKYINQGWKKHWNYKVYSSEKYALEAIEQMKKAYDFYKNDYDWRIVELYYR